MSEDVGVTDRGDPWSYFPPPDQVAGVPPVGQQRPWHEVLLPPVRTFLATVAVTVLLGAPLALLWRAVADPPVVERTASGPVPVAPESNQVFAVDGAFIVVTLVAGAVVGTLAWVLLRDRGPAGPFGLAAGGLLAAFVTAAVGKRFVVDDYLHSVCSDCLVYDGTLHLYSTAAVIVLPVAMLTAFALMTFFFDRRGT